jgi:hypothetical protein
LFFFSYFEKEICIPKTVESAEPLGAAPIFAATKYLCFVFAKLAFLKQKQQFIGA